MRSSRLRSLLSILALSLFGSAAVPICAAQQLDNPTVVGSVDAQIDARYRSVLEATVIEHYAVYRGDDEVHPAAEMTVKDHFHRGSGKTYTILSESGSELIRKIGLHPLLESEKNINRPDHVKQSWFTSANYDMQLKPGGVQKMDGRDCLALAIKPHHKATNLIVGTLWVDAKDYSVVRIEGVASKSPSMWAGTTQMMRQYADITGFSQPTHARAVSNSAFFGRTVVTVDYRDYQIQLTPDK